jgi:hypothetical protein
MILMVQVSGYKRNKCKFRIKGSIITLGMRGGTNKPKNGYLNATVKMLIKRQLDGKINLQQIQLVYRQVRLLLWSPVIKETGGGIKSFRKDKNIYD